jgi:AraC-like DNA-binding protein
VATYATTLPAESRKRFVFRRMPESSTHVFLLVERFDRDGAMARARLVVAGPRSILQEVEHGPAPAEIVGFEIRAGSSRAVLGASASDFRDREVLLEDVWGGAARELLERLAEARDPHARWETLLAAVGARVAAAPSERASHAAMRILQSNGGRLSVQAIADQLGWSTRQLQRHFLDDVGLTPKRCARMARLRRLFEGTWSDGASVAAELGYSDHAHLIDEFRALMGATPGRFFATEDFADATIPLGWLVTPRVC